MSTDKSSDQDSPGTDTDEWRDVVEAVERATPVYEWISEVISLGLAKPLRRRAIARLERNQHNWILDSGSGPGTSTRLLTQQGYRNVVAVDPSRILLAYSRSKSTKDFESVRAIDEYLPFRTDTFAGILTCFSLRDVRNTRNALEEFKRVIRPHGKLEIVDVGKPDDNFLRIVADLYVSHIMPSLTRLLIGGKIRGNPFRIIAPTFHRLRSNRQLSALVAKVFGTSHLEEFLVGGMIIIEGRPQQAKCSKQ